MHNNKSKPIFKLSKKHIIAQLGQDIIGKDSYRGVTLTYAWLANQFGHIGLGFLPTVLIFKILWKWLHWPIRQACITAAITVALGWAIFEAYNLLKPLLFSKSNNLVTLNKKKSYTFNPKWHNLVYDTVTDVLFFAFGAVLAGMLMCYSNWWLIPFFILAIILFISSRYWYYARVYLQQARYPFQFRLSQWNKDLLPEDKKQIEEFIATNRYQHLLINGPYACGKTSLGVGVATEYSMLEYRSYYISAIKLLTALGYEKEAEQPQELFKIWDWKDCDMLIIDDVNPEDNIGTLIKPELVGNLITKYKAQHYFANKKVIWILGEKANTPLSESITKTWYQLMHEIAGITYDKIALVNLNKQPGVTELYGGKKHAS